MDLAVDTALEKMPEDFEIRPFLIANRAEVKSMLLTEYNEEKVMEKERQEGHREGVREGRQESRLEDIKKLMESLRLSAKQAMDALQIPSGEQKMYMKLL